MERYRGYRLKMRMLPRDYYRIQILKINTARIKLWAIESKRGKWWTRCDLSINAMPLSNRNGSGKMQRSWNLWVQHLYQMRRTPIALSGWGSRMYSHCPHLVARKLLKATPADLSLGLISYLKNSRKQDSTQSLEYRGWACFSDRTVVSDVTKLLHHLYFDNSELIPLR